jgi:hypothetical protein
VHARLLQSCNSAYYIIDRNIIGAKVIKDTCLVAR